MYEKAIEMHRFFLNWRYRLLAGYIVILWTLVYSLAKLNENTDNYNAYFISICITGIIITIIFVFLSARNTVLYWKCNNTAYYSEKEMVEDFKFEGLYSLLIDDKIKKDINNMLEENIGSKKYKKLYKKLYKSDNAYSLDIRGHTGAINWVYLLSFLGFLLTMLYKIVSIIHCTCPFALPCE